MTIKAKDQISVVDLTDVRRTFTGSAEPVPPYDVGDLWAQGTTTGDTQGSGDLLKCITAKTKDQTYDAADWELATNYKTAIEETKIAVDDTNAHLADNYYTKDETDAAALQTAADIAAAAQAAADAAAAAGQASDKSDSQYADLLQNINDVSDTNSGKWDNLENRITMDSTGINIAVDDANGSSLKLTGNRISFRQGGTEVAYIEGKKLVIESGVFMKSLEVNGFAWTPRSNGNLSFGKAVS